MDRSDSGQAQVLIVGAGPAGLVAGITLARYGVTVLVVEKRDEISTLARALVISTRSMEILRAWGLEHEVRAGAADVEPLGWVTHTLASGEGLVVPSGHPTAAQAAQVSPTRPAWTPQDHLEPILLAYLHTLPSAQVRFGVELVTLQQDDNSARVALRERASEQTWEVETLFVLGADGAHSTVRSQLKIQMAGSENLAVFHTVQFTAPLAQVVADHRYGLNIITHPDASGVLAPRGRQDRWGFTREWRPGQTRLADLSSAQLTELLATATGAPDVQPLIERVSIFTFAAQLADRYREGRGFLIGDAAHRMTPRGGTGMNTAIHDAYDLGWKLAWILRGWAAPGLLDSYEVERRPVGLHNVARSRNPNGAQREFDEAAPWDLNGRLAHHWIEYEHRTVSTLDLLGDGLTLLADHSEVGWANAKDVLDAYAPVAVHALDASTASCLRIPPGGAILLRPDGQQVGGWPGLSTLLHNGALPGHFRRRTVN